MPKLSTHSDEFALIERRLQSQPIARAIVGIGDDAAVLPGGLLVATDTLLEGVHFDATASPELIGRKALAVNLSDIAAMAGAANAATLALTINRAWKPEFVERVLDGLLALAAEFDVEVVGGDTTTWDQPAAISVTVLGHADDPILRSGGRPGDSLFVTGPLGRSLPTGHHLTFSPRVRESLRVVSSNHVTAMIDLSDGLSSDGAHLAVASGCGMRLEAAAIPRRDNASLTEALNDGEDFELLFASEADAIEGAVRIGRLTESPDRVIDVGGTTQLLRPGGWSHSLH